MPQCVQLRRGILSDVTVDDLVQCGPGMVHVTFNVGNHLPARRDSQDEVVDVATDHMGNPHPVGERGAAWAAVEVEGDSRIAAIRSRASGMSV